MVKLADANRTMRVTPDPVRASRLLANSNNFQSSRRSSEDSLEDAGLGRDLRVSMNNLVGRQNNILKNNIYSFSLSKIHSFLIKLNMITMIFELGNRNIVLLVVKTARFQKSKR